MIYHVLFHIRADDTAASHLDLNGLGQDPTSQRLHGSGEGGRKHDRLTVWTHVVHNTHHLVEEPDTPGVSEFCLLKLILELIVLSICVSLLYSAAHPNTRRNINLGDTHLWLEAHVKHPVCFVQHHIRNSAQVGDSTYTPRERSMRETVNFKKSRSSYASCLLEKH